MYSPNKFVTWAIHASLMGLSRKLSLHGDKFRRRLLGYYCDLQACQKSRVADEYDDRLQSLVTSLNSTTLTAFSVSYIFTNKFVTWVITTFLVGLSRKLSLHDDELRRRVLGYYCEFLATQKLQVADNNDDCLQRLVTSLSSATLTVFSVS